MMIIHLTYVKPLDQVERHLPAHREYLSQYYDQGVFLLSGPKQPRDGGVIIANTDRKTAAEIIQQDPFYQHEIADYQLIEFQPNRHQHGLKAVLGL